MAKGAGSRGIGGFCTTSTVSPPQRGRERCTPPGSAFLERVSQSQRGEATAQLQRPGAAQASRGAHQKPRDSGRFGSPLERIETVPLSRRRRSRCHAQHIPATVSNVRTRSDHPMPFRSHRRVSPAALGLFAHFPKPEEREYGRYGQYGGLRQQAWPTWERGPSSVTSRRVPPSCTSLRSSPSDGDALAAPVDARRRRRGQDCLARYGSAVSAGHVSCNGLYGGRH
jgi:hypothetical protein